MKVIFDNCFPATWNGITLILLLVNVRSPTGAARIMRNTMSFSCVHARICVVVKFSSKIVKRETTPKC